MSRRDELADDFVPGADDLLLDLGLVWLFGGAEAVGEWEARRGAWEAREEQQARESQPYQQQAPRDERSHFEDRSPDGTASGSAR